MYKREQADTSQNRPVLLTSVLELQKESCNCCRQYLRNIIREHTMVGLVDPRFALIQHETSLYLSNTEKLSEELFYQILLFRFGNLNVLRLSEPAPIAELAQLAAEMDPALASGIGLDVIKEATRIKNFLMSKRQMLWDYFSIELNDGNLMSLPDLVSGFVPQLDALPVYIWQMANNVDWTSEKECFESFSRITARFYAVKRQFCDQNGKSSQVSSSGTSWKHTIQNILYPEFKARLLPPADLLTNFGILKLTELQELYKSFERC